MDAFVKDTFSSIDNSESLLYKLKCDRFVPENKDSQNTSEVKNKTEKGILFLVKTKSNQAYFCWMNSETNTIVDDYVLFQNNIRFKEMVKYSNSCIVKLELLNNNKEIYYWIYDSEEFKNDEVFKKVENVRGCSDFNYNFPGVPFLNYGILSSSNKCNVEVSQFLNLDEITQLFNLWEYKVDESNRILSECDKKIEKHLDILKLIKEGFLDDHNFEQSGEVFDIKPLQRILKNALDFYDLLKAISKGKVSKNKNEEEVKSSPSSLPFKNIAKTADLEKHGKQIQNQSGNPKGKIKKATRNNHLGSDKKSSTKFPKKESNNKNKKA